MFQRVSTLIMVLLLGLGSSAIAQEASPTASLAGTDGPVKITGTFEVDNFSIAEAFPNPTFALIDASQQVPISTHAFVDRSVQILGVNTSPLDGSSPTTFEVLLPITPQAAPFSITGEGEGSAGLKVFMAQAAANIFKDSYLQQLEQTGYTSFNTNLVTGWFTDGTLLAHAADDQQQFPSGFGADGLWFTADDDLMTLDPGYTVVTLAQDGTSTTDRSATPTMNVGAGTTPASPDYSDKTWVEAFDALIDMLETRYAFTELNHINFDDLRAEYGPKIQDAQDKQDLTLYVGTLFQLANSFDDAHVQIEATTNDSSTALGDFLLTYAEGITSTVGAYGTLVTNPDDPAAPPISIYEIVAVSDSGPAHDAGWVPGTRIVTINGQTIPERLAALPWFIFGSGAGTIESRDVYAAASMLLFPKDAKVTIEYTLPGETELRTVDMVAGAYPLGIEAATTSHTPKPLVGSTYADLDGYTVIAWPDFMSNIPERIAVLEAALAHHQTLDNPQGIILDMRGNSGGLEELYMIMASYFYTEDHPLSTDVFTSWEYDDASGTHVPEFTASLEMSSPRPDLAYTGPLAVLVDQGCASSCEFFTQTLQVTGRATVIGQHGTAGAGGNVNRATMPEGVIFQYTIGQFTFAGTDDYNIQGKGVSLDVRMPVTVENFLQHASGYDVLLTYAIDFMSQQVEESEGTPVASPIATLPVSTPVPLPTEEATPAA